MSRLMTGIAISVGSTLVTCAASAVGWVLGAKLAEKVCMPKAKPGV